MNKVDKKIEGGEFHEKLVELYEALGSCFTSRDPMIVGRDKEEKIIKEFLEEYIINGETGGAGVVSQKSSTKKAIAAKEKFPNSAILYICGHPGQGKTAV